MGGRLGDRHRTERSVNPSLRSLTSSRSMALATVHASRVRNCSRTPGGICLIVSSMVTTTDQIGKPFVAQPHVQPLDGVGYGARIKGPQLFQDSGGNLPDRLVDGHYDRS